MFTFLFLLTASSAAAVAQYANYFYPQSTSYGTHPFAPSGYASGGYPYGGQFGSQYGYPMQMPMQQSYYTAPQSYTFPQMMGGSTVTAAQTTTATIPGTTQLVLPNQGMMGGQPLAQMYQQPTQVYQQPLQVSTPPVVTTSQVPSPAATSVVQSNTVIEGGATDEPPAKHPQASHFDYYAFARDDLDGQDDTKLRSLPHRRPSRPSRPAFLRNGSPVKGTPPEHFEYSAHGRSEPELYTP